MRPGFGLKGTGCSISLHDGKAAPRALAGGAPMVLATSTAGSTSSTSCSTRLTTTSRPRGPARCSRVCRRPHRPRAELGAGDRAPSDLRSSGRSERSSSSAITRRCCSASLPEMRTSSPSGDAFGGTGMPRQLWRRCGSSDRPWRRGSARDRSATAIPREHVEFLESFDDSCRFGDYLFVHAGIRPGVEIDQQRQSDLRWIREPFLFDETDHGFVVVHGHTIRPEVEMRPNRIGIDTGAYRTGCSQRSRSRDQVAWLLDTRTAEKEVVSS